MKTVDTAAELSLYLMAKLVRQDLIAAGVDAVRRQLGDLPWVRFSCRVRPYGRQANPGKRRKDVKN
ncbi:hypothetical protein [Renibacterium salmoninarum]|uniref:hypothetical protein n=1 Tax=Renibacterium salmoninarum TaxID=1646 RepID=UPI0011AB369C|nr:hypothetical protein [Renibacterium salmoninarum]